MTAKNRQRDGFVRAMADTFDYLPDGAYFAVLGECGIGVDDLAAISEDKPRPKPKRRRGKKRKGTPADV